MTQTLQDQAKSVFIKTYGCQMNVYDSERMADALSSAGYSPTGNAEGADLIVLNTCHIREKATEKIYSELGRYRPQKTRNPNLRIVVAGCVAQAEGEEIVRRQPMVDVVVGPQAYHNLPALLERAVDGKQVVDRDFPEESKFDRLPELPRGRLASSAFVTIQEGCDKFCTFCVVPYTRGAEFSRPVSQVVEEVERRLLQGVREVTLLGQNVNAYHGAGPDGSDWSLARLMERLAELPQLERIRYTTSHPKDMTEDLIEVHGSCGKLMPYLHLPVQSGSDRILKAMNRKHTAEEYCGIIERLRRARNDILLSSDFIVGFPGETERDFRETLSLVREVEFGQAYSFKYSARPGTPAAERPQVDPEEASARLRQLQDLLLEQQRAAQDAMVGQDTKVLLERRGRKPGQLVGKSEHMHAVHVDCSPDMTGTVRHVRITRSEANSLAGELLSP